MDNTARANAPRFDLPRICLWIALALALIGTVGNTAWAFASVDEGAQLMSYVKAIALDVGMVAVAATLAQRKRAHASTRWLWVAVVCFVLGSMYANYLHGQTHLVANTANLADWRPVILSALLPLMLFALVEIVAQAPAERASEPQPVAEPAQPITPKRKPVHIVRSLRRKPRIAAPEPVAPTPQPIAVAPVELHCPNECGRTFRNQQALAGHLKACNARMAAQPVTVVTNGNGAH